ncbi:ABC transporter substrate-binding protein [Streptomyces cavernae]|uniref:ABC transporter substrate-binding protein n=1 Tax=Streptomyces cavernae TaxID=2259034 RepID=UPI000FEBC691|nr:ABC transporter substrate-binding protein [Streptomyces cavernae]
MKRRDLLRGGALLAASVPAAGLLSACSPNRVAPAAGRPVRGGVLRVGVSGGSAKDTLDPHNPLSYPDQARVVNLYEPLFHHDAAYRLKPFLAESLEPSKDGRTWLLRLRAGVEFHNGKTLDARDVIATLRRIVDPKAPTAGATSLSVVDAGRLRRVDATTVEIPLKHPYALLKDLLAQYSLGIVPEDFDLRKPVGTGPFAYKSFAPGDRSAFTRFDGYWRRPAHLDELHIIDFPDDTAKINSLLSAQIHAIDNLPPAYIDMIEKQGGQVLISETGSWNPITMRVDTPPFKDVRVRQAFRLIVDRPQMVKQVLGGQGRVGNDLYAPFDVAYNSDLPQRHQDLGRARSLLKAAGQENLTVELVTSGGIGSGAIEAAQLFAQQAKGAGVKVKVRITDSATFYGDRYLSWPFAQDYWFTRNYLPQVDAGSLKTSPYNETHWNDAEFNTLMDRARRESDASKRNELLKAAQRTEYDRGGHIIWGFKNQVDAYAANVTGFTANRNLPLSNYEFRNVSVSG